MSNPFTTTTTVPTGQNLADPFEINFSWNWLDEGDFAIYKNGAATKMAANTYALLTRTKLGIKTGNYAIGDQFTVQRETQLENPNVTFAPGSPIRAQDLNNNNKQARYGAEEVKAYAVNKYAPEFLENIELSGKKVTGLGNATTDSDAVNRDQLAKVITDDLIGGDGITLTDAVGGTNSGDTTTVSVTPLGITTTMIADDAVTMDKLSNADVVEISAFDSSWAGDDTKIATVGALEARHDVVVNTDVNPPSTTQKGKQWLSTAPGNQVHKIFDGSGWRTVAVGQPYSPATTTVVRYVDITNGSDASDVTGFLPQAPLRSIERALALVNASATGDGTLIKVAPGVYQEELPLRIAKNNVSIVGESMRSCFVHPTVSTENNDMFEVDSGSYIANLTLLGLKVPDANQGSRNNTLDNDATHGLPTNQPFAVRFRTDVAPTILKSPYVQNCTHFSDAHFDNATFDPNTFPSTDEDQTFSAVAGDESSAPCGGGLLVDGNAVSSSSPIRSMVVDAFTQICLDGPGILVTNNGYAQLVSFFGTFCHYHAKAKNGGQINLSNCVSDFGRFGLIADGKSPSPIATATATAANAGATTITVGSIQPGSFHGTVTQPLDHMMVTIDGVDYGVVSSTANGAGWDIVLTTGLTSNITNTTVVEFALRSYISTGGHTFEFVGVGTDYGDHPDNGGVPVEANQVVELNGGKVWQSSTDHVGKFKAGDVLVVDQVSETVALKDTTVTGDLAVTGTVDGRDVATDGNTLDALNTNAVLDTDTTTANMQFVVDEDNMASNLDTKVPTQQSVKAYVDTEIADLVDSAPAALDTLNELAAALNDDANFSTTVTNSIATKLNASAVSAYGATLVDDADAATARTTLGLGTAAVAATSDFATAAQGTTADNALAASAVSTFGGTLIDDANAATARTTLGLGTAATSATGDFATAAQGTTADNALQDLVDDTMPQLGGSLDVNDKTITNSGSNAIQMRQPLHVQHSSPQINIDATFGNNNPNNLESKLSMISGTDGASAILCFQKNGSTLENSGNFTDGIVWDHGTGELQLFTNSVNCLTFGNTGKATFADNLIVNDVEISTTSGNKNIKLNPHGTGTIDCSGAVLTGLGAPSATGDAATKGYVDTQISGSGQVNSDWNATSGVAEILNKPTIPAAQVNSDWNSSSGVSEILNKPTIPSGNVVDDTVPELGGNLDAKGNTIIDTSATNADIKLRPNGSGAVEVRGDGTTSGEVGKLKLNCSTNGHGVILASPPHSAAASYTLTLPPDAGSNNQVLKTDGSGTTSWVDQTTAYTDSSVDSHLNQSTAGNGEVLSWNTSTSDYEWVAQSGGGGSTSPGGSNTQVQFNSSGSFAGSANLTFDGTNLTVGGTLTAVSPTGGAGGHRKIHTSTSSPTSSDGADGDIWIKYT